MAFIAPVKPGGALARMPNQRLERASAQPPPHVLTAVGAGRSTAR